MLSQPNLPPSDRDFAVFAAEKFHLSQTRICQIVERMRQWQEEVLSPASALPEAVRLWQAKLLASQRLDHLYSEMMGAWRQSQGEVCRRRKSRFGDEVTTTFRSAGDPKYLLAASRLATAQAELGVFGARLCPPEDAEEGGKPEARPTSHPAGACSARGGWPPAAATPAAQPGAATPAGNATSAALSLRQATARREFFAPVQPPQLAPSDSSVTQPEVTPEQLGLSVDDILSRRERRHRKRAGQVR